MRNPETILNSLSAHSKDVHYKYERLYRILFNEQMFYVAYQRIYAKPGNMTPGSDGKTIDGMSVDRIGHLIAALKDESYMPTPARRVYIPKKNGKKRPLGIPSIEDKMVQEVVRLILEAVYEGHFENSSHGFRPRRSCHTALRSIQTLFTGANWFIEGDIKGFFDNIDHHILIETLRERISDERFLRLIWKFLKAGYIEDFTFHKTYSGTPQGGIISPILANIYLDKFDKYMREYAESFDKGKKRRENPLHASYSRKAVRLRKAIRNATDEDTKRELLTQLKEMETEEPNEIAARAIKLFGKRWIKKYNGSIKHWLVTELGHGKRAEYHKSTERLHLHGFLWTTKSASEIEETWGYGWVDTGEYVNDVSVGYCVKYVSKVDPAHPGFISKIFASKGLGKGWLNRYEARLNKFQGENTREYYKTPSGQKLAIPTYFRNKLWTDEEREQLWLQKLNKQTRYVRGEKIDISTIEGEREYGQALKYRQDENVALGYPAEPWNLEKYKKSRKKFGL